ncbi:MAG: carbamoyltransferase HypF [Acidimicrobiales bacterium]
MVSRERLRVTGTVQGVGFRPFVYQIATDLGLSGFVLNDSSGVVIEAEGTADALTELARRVAEEPPPLARVVDVVREPIGCAGTSGFTIRASDAAGPPTAAVSVDTAACADCIREVDDPTDRRYGYPFTNCTNCGPRYTIVRSVPYDRSTTTMAPFVMCAQCDREYHDPSDRRFHAQPNACPRCGPRVMWRSTLDGGTAAGPEALSRAAEALGRGEIVAIKGVGGFHIAVDATSNSAVRELRRRKTRDHKPFAVMVSDIEYARTLATIDDSAGAELMSARRPIVLLPKLSASPLADAVSPGLAEVGLLLAYSPLHHLLMAATGIPLVMTSGNVSDEPIAHVDTDAFERLGPLVDGFLTNDRAIHIRCDDSVVRSIRGSTQLLRRSRGYAPEPVALPIPARGHVLALGAELKSTVAVARDRFVVVSHHIGDLEHLATYRSFLQAIDHLCHLFAVSPGVVVHDLHPEYLSSKLAAELDLPTLAVQHHHAHVASCMVEHGRVTPVLGLAFDGLGYGPDDTMWGGEYLVADLRSSRRVAHLLPVVMPGGAAAIREPWRMAMSWGSTAGLPPSGLLSSCADQAARTAVASLIARRQGTITTGMGRLFDAVAVLLGGRGSVGYEAQAAIEFEAMARSVDRAMAPRFAGTVGVDRSGPLPMLDPTPLLRELLEGREARVGAAELAAGFHEALGRGAASLAIELAQSEGIDAIVLTGGVFQNARFSEVVEEEIAKAGIRVLTHALVPPNDGGISVGQAAIAAAACA